MARFAAIGLDHRHIYDLTQGLLDAGATCAGHTPDTTDPRVLAGFRKRFPEVPAIERARLLADPSIDFVVIAAVPRDRAALAVEAMRGGKHVMTDKPGVTTPAQLEAVRAAVAETGRVWSICLGRLASPAVQEALRLVRAGTLGRLVQVVSLAPHRLNRDLRPSWFFDKPAYGGIINDIGVHSIDQFLALADASDAELVSSTIGAFGTQPPGFEDFAEITLQTPSGTRVCSRRLVHPGRAADLGRRAAVPAGDRGHAGAAQEPRYRGPARHRPPVPGDAGSDPAHRLQPAAGDLLPRFPGRYPRRNRDHHAPGRRLHGLPPGPGRAGAGHPLHPQHRTLRMIGFAVIGLGNALEPHAKALADLKDRAHVVWGVARSRRRAEVAATTWGYPVTADALAAIADPAVQAVLILTPANAHLPFAEAAFAAGKHVLCEKPLEASVARGGADRGRRTRRRPPAGDHAADAIPQGKSAA